jgi:hypothetical protein
MGNNKCLTSLIVLLFAATASAQSYLYNEKGQLILDTSLTISQSQLMKWRQAENNIVAWLSRIKIPDLYREGVVKPQGGTQIFIAGFTVDSADIKDIEVLNDTSWYANAVVKGLKEQGKNIARTLKSRSRITQDQVYMGKYYVAVNFLLISFYEHLKNDKAVPIIQGTIPIIESLIID